MKPETNINQMKTFLGIFKFMPNVSDKTSYIYETY